ncbi:aspartic proteinase Asp1-like isoform X2 [Tripterygium wilfordii]|uniref:Aspartic proteinase Asp1-like isoform X2 n=1 Tax=Tripterygium wilfordii TaxID=458696 RepID=A0A7J7CN00_TRIWF|nr:aspartic proteinase Asp1-like isoform X2 [Tripterygium wilfordii]
MEGKRLIIVLPSMMMIVVLLCTIFEGSLATSSIVFSLSGNAYPKGAYFVDIYIGDQAKPFELHVDTGSSLTWVKCVEPFENYAQSMTIFICDFSMALSFVHFWCGYKQTGAFDGAGIFGLSRGPLGFSSQIHSQGLTQQVTSHCLSSRGGGFLFIGDDLVPPSGISWTPITIKSNHGQDYGSGPVELLFNGSSTQVRGLQFVFDSGSDLSYLNHPPYQDTLDWISDALKRTPLIRTQPMGIFPICWKHNKIPIRSFDDVKNYFKSLTLNFTNVPNIKLNLPVHAYLIHVGVNLCLAILDCGQVDVENPNVIGVFSMQDKLMIYDNVNHRIGWASRNCNMPAWR